jgi:alpha-L-fucosidase 2
MFAHLRALSLFFPLTMAFFHSGRAVNRRPPGLFSDIEYAQVQNISLRMDGYVQPGDQPVPAVIIVHGGGWVAGDRRREVQPLFKPLEDAGFAWFSISYRLATDMMQFGVAIDDVSAAIRYVRSHAAEFNVDPDRIALVGESAGGQLAAMAALRGGPGVVVKGVVALYTPTDLGKLLRNSQYIPAQIRDSVQGTPWEAFVLAALTKLSPIDNVRRDMPPFLFIHGTADPLVPLSQSTEMCDKMRSVGASCEVFKVQGAGHGIRWWESSPQYSTAYKQKMVEWLRAELAAGTQARSPRVAS